MVKAFVFVLMFWSLPLAADTVEVDVDGVDGAMLTNVRAHLGLVTAERLDEVSAWRLRQLADEARTEIRQALEPFGYYRPRIEVRLIEPEGEGPWRASIQIQPGQQVTIAETNIDIEGDGAGDAALLAWENDWPLAIDSPLLHADYDTAWRELDRLAQQRGYFDAEFRERRVTVDPDRATATISIRFDTGRRFRFADYSVSDIAFSPRLIDRLTIIKPGEHYSSQRLDQQREALVRSGLFERVVVDEQRDDEQAEVSLNYDLRERKPSSYRATLGFGTDTGARIQLGWTRHYLSSRGNRLELGLGAQQKNSEYVFRSDYRHPRGSQPGDFLTAGLILRREQDDFRFIDEDRRDAVFDAFDGRLEQAELTFGRLQNRGLWSQEDAPLEERVFLAALNESFNALREGSFSEENEALLAAYPELDRYLETETNTLALGASWRLPNVRGSGFFAEGQILQARLLGASESVGSDVSFAQAYVSGRWHQLFGDRHKLMLRGEAGYTEADTETFDLALDDRNLRLTITELPERYRFKTGGDRTVRGYAFEALSTNRNGANHILTGSLEYEYRVGNDWSLAAFYDIGNAFNEFKRVKLKRGVGVGFRWYTVIGPIQVDLAQALDDAGKPWRLHLTIGTRLL